VRIVIDTNVLLSAVLWYGAPHTLLNQLRSGAAELIITQELIDEITRVIHRDKFATILKHANSKPEQILEELRALAEVIVAAPLAQPVCRDPDDDAVLACAVSGRADCIVSGDADLLVLKSYESIPILNAAGALQLLYQQA
jgi:putative PIN family toxin of toxin-antitoxin system